MFKLENFRKSESATAIVLIIANLFPLIGLLFFDWNAFNIIMFYVIESFILGIFIITKNSLLRGLFPTTFLYWLSQSRHRPVTVQNTGLCNFIIS
jgi:hypothetical protein